MIKCKFCIWTGSDCNWSHLDLLYWYLFWSLKWVLFVATSRWMFIPLWRSTILDVGPFFLKRQFLDFNSSFYIKLKIIIFIRKRILKFLQELLNIKTFDFNGESYYLGSCRRELTQIPDEFMLHRCWWRQLVTNVGDQMCWWRVWVVGDKSPHPHQELVTIGNLPSSDISY